MTLSNPEARDHLLAVSAASSMTELSRIAGIMLRLS